MDTSNAGEKIEIVFLKMKEEVGNTSNGDPFCGC